MARILTPNYIPTALGLTPIERYTTSPNCYKCIKYGEEGITDSNGKYISDPLCKFRYSNDYYLYWNNRTSSNQNQLIHSYLKYSRHMDANTKFYKMYTNTLHGETITLQGTGMGQWGRNYYYPGFTESSQYWDEEERHLTTSFLNRSFSYSAVGSETNIAGEGYDYLHALPVDYLGKCNQSYTAYLIYSTPNKMWLRDRTGSEPGLTTNTSSTETDITTDYKLSIINSVINTSGYPPLLKTILGNFCNHISNGNYLDIITPVEHLVIYLQNSLDASNHYSTIYDYGFLKVNKKRYYNLVYITPNVNISDTGYCYSSLMYSVLNQVCGTVTLYQSGATLGLSNGYVMPYYAGGGTYSVLEGMIIASDLYTDPYYDLVFLINKLYEAFLTNHIGNFKEDIGMSSHTFYYTTYYMIVKMSRLQIIINNYLTPYSWWYIRDASNPGSTYIGSHYRDTYSIANNNANKYIPIPLFTIAIDTNSYNICNLSTNVPLSLIILGNDLLPLSNQGYLIFTQTANNSEVYSINCDRETYLLSKAYFIQNNIKNTIP